MIHRLTEAERKEQYQQQLQDDAILTVKKFLSEPKYEAVRQEYAHHFDAIKATIDTPRITLRTCAEDIMSLSPIISEAISCERLFFQELRRAIEEGFLTKKDLDI